MFAGATFGQLEVDTEGLFLTIDEVAKFATCAMDGGGQAVGVWPLANMYLVLAGIWLCLWD